MYECVCVNMCCACCTCLDNKRACNFTHYLCEKVHSRRLFFSRTPTSIASLKGPWGAARSPWLTPLPPPPISPRRDARQPMGGEPSHRGLPGRTYTISRPDLSQLPPSRGTAPAPATPRRVLGWVVLTPHLREAVPFSRKKLPGSARVRLLFYWPYPQGLFWVPSQSARHFLGNVFGPPNFLWTQKPGSEPTPTPGAGTP